MTGYPLQDEKHGHLLWKAGGHVDVGKIAEDVFILNVKQSAAKRVRLYIDKSRLC